MKSVFLILLLTSLNCSAEASRKCANEATNAKRICLEKARNDGAGLSNAERHNCLADFKKKMIECKGNSNGGLKGGLKGGFLPGGGNIPDTGKL